MLLVVVVCIGGPGNTDRVGVALERMHEHVRQNACAHAHALPGDGVGGAVGLEGEFESRGEVLVEPGAVGGVR